jgi:hypothetical protein
MNAPDAACIPNAGSAYKQQINHYKKGLAPMKFYWGLPSIPELQGLPLAQQRQLWRAGVAMGLRTRRIVGISALVAGGVAVAVMLIALLVGIYHPAPSGNGAIWVALAIGGGALAGRQVHIAAIRPWLAAQRAALDPNPARGDM